MIATSMSRTVVPFMALVAAVGLAVVFAVQHVRREPQVDIIAETVAPLVSKPGARDQGPAATAQAEANGVASLSAGSQNGDGVPTFDIARIEPTGEAVIAGRAPPGATVELLRDGGRHDSAVADQSGQFVMVPPRLPPGTYGLTLRSTQVDGKQAMSKQSVAVALDPPFNVPDTMVTASVPAKATKSKLPNLAAAQPPQLAAAVSTAPPDRVSPSAVVVPKIATTMVSRGDSLWRISRFTYGAGTRYAFIYRVNRRQIRNPNLIYPGQIFVLPTR